MGVEKSGSRNDGLIWRLFGTHAGLDWALVGQNNVLDSRMC